MTIPHLAEPVLRHDLDGPYLERIHPSALPPAVSKTAPNAEADDTQRPETD